MLDDVAIDTLARELGEVLRRHLTQREESPGWLTVRDACRVTGLSRAQLYRMMGAGEIPFSQITPHRRVIAPRDLEAFRVARRAS